MEYTVTTQDEFDAVAAKATLNDTIIILSGMIRIRVTPCLVTLSGNARADLFDNARADLSGDARANLYEHARANLSGDTRANLYEHARANLYEHARADLFEHARANLYEHARADLFDNARADLSGDARATLYGNASATLSDNARASLYGNARASLYGNASASLSGNARASLYGNARASLYGNARATAKGGAHVFVADAASVEAGPYVAVTRQPGHTGAVTGGVVVALPVVETVEAWCEWNEVEVATATEDGKATLGGRTLTGLPPKQRVALLYKGVNESFQSSREYSYQPGTTPVADDWDDGQEECGGGLHFCAAPAETLLFISGGGSIETRFLACPVALDDIRNPKPTDRFPNKVKARGLIAPCWEVDIDGNPIAEGKPPRGSK